MTRSTGRVRTARRCANLLVSASLLAVAGAMGAHAQEAATAAPLTPSNTSTATPDAGAALDTIVVTGSLIHGAEAVGTPVVTLGAQDFKKNGAVTIGDVLLAEPAITMIAGSNVINGGGYVARAQNINIRNLSQKGTRTLLMIDGMRFPNQGNGGCQTDPSIIPQLAVDRIDILTDGASATYGSDAVAGVVNVILKRNFDGAKAQFQYGQSLDIGGQRAVFSGLLGHSWELGSDGLKGNVTVSYEHYDQAHISGLARPYFTQDFTSYGADDRRNIINSRPGIVSTGAAKAAANAPGGFAANLGQNCINCFSIPHGQNGVGLTWNQILANPGEANEINVFSDGWEAPKQQRDAFTATFDQQLTSKISFYGDMFYSSRSSQMIGQSSTNSQSVTLPSTYGFYPIGAPAGLVDNYDLALEVPDKVRTISLAERYNFGLKFDLPHEWNAKVYRSSSFINEVDKTTGLVNKNNVNAAVGNTVAAVPGTASSPAIPAFTKPANLPYLNLFCDPTAFTCNSADVLNYISGFRNNNMKQQLTEYGGTADGPLFGIPGGEVRAAVGALYTSTDYKNSQFASNANTTQVVSTVIQRGARDVSAVFGQLNVPVFGKGFSLPFVESLNLEGSLRYDHYSDVGGTTNPKIGVDWGVGWGLTLRGAVGTSFRAPSFQENANAGPTAINIAASAASNTIGTCANVGDKALPGTIAALIDPTCSAANQFLGGLSLLNAAQSAAAIRPGGVNLQPEKGQNLTLGFKFQPGDGDGPFAFLKGLTVEPSYWYVRIRNKLQGTFGLASLANGQLNDPNYTFSILTAANDPQFAQHVLALLNNPLSAVPVTVAPNISYIVDGAIRNIGWQAESGVDLKANYRWDMGNYGRWVAGIDGTITIENNSKNGPGQALISYYALNHDGRFRYRANLGWQDLDKWGGDWNINAFMNFIPHYEPSTNPLPPACFESGNLACNSSGLPQYAKYTSQSLLTNRVSGVYTFDLSVGYDTGSAPKQDFLKNVQVQVTMTNVFNKSPPYQYAISPPGGGAPHAFFTSTAGTELGIMGRSANIAITKSF